MDEKTNNLVAKHARKYNKAAVHKDRKKALKKGDRKHKGRYEDSGNVEERSTLDSISSFLGRTKDKKKYDAALKAVKSKKYSVTKAAQVFGISPRSLQDLVAEESMNEKKGLWDRIHAKRKRGESPAKPGDKDYPKTLDVGEEVEQVDEISKGLKSRYMTKAQMDAFKKIDKANRHKPESPESKKHMASAMKRGKGMALARKKMNEGKELHIRMDNFNGPEEKKVMDILRKHEIKGSITYSGETDKGIIFDIKKPAMLNGINRELKKASSAGSILEGLKQARKNVGSDSCWDGYKAKGTKMKNGKEVPDCKKEDVAEARMMSSGDYKISSEKSGKGYRAKVVDGSGKEMYLGSAVYKTPKAAEGEADAYHRGYFRQGGSDKVARNQMMNYRKKNDMHILEGSSAQDRLDRRAAKHGLGKTNKAADDYISMMMKKYGAKDRADLNRKMGMKESINLRSHLEELTQRELDQMAARKDKNLIKRGKKKAEPKKPSSAGRTQNVGRSGGEDDSSLVMQLRKAQDLRGNHEIQFKGGKTKLPKQMIDKLLKTYEKLSKPADKKKFETLVTHELRKKEGIATKNPKTASDKAMDKFNKTQKKGLPAPRGKKSGPSPRDLRDIERGK